MQRQFTSQQLEAFHALAMEESFSKAARALGITQPALSQRIKSLEVGLDVALIVRGTKSITLTEAGERLFQYCRLSEQLESEAFEQIVGNAGGHGGVLRIGGFSSILRSVIIPSVAPLIRENPGLQFRFISGEIHALETLLLSGKVDYMVNFNPINRVGIRKVFLGVERNVVVESTKFEGRRDYYLDHDPDDDFSERFLLAQPKPFHGHFNRSYGWDIYGIIDCVRLGLGRGMVPLHLIPDDQSLRILPGFKPLDMQLHLYFREQSVYTRLHDKVVEAMVHTFAEQLPAERP